MTTVRLSDLSPKARAKVEAAANAPARKPGRGKSRAGISTRAPCPGHCTCGQPFPTAHTWELHAKAAGHTRWNIDLEAADS
jgi:hypothetical protein